jgi:hypothetical protein
VDRVKAGVLPISALLPTLRTLLPRVPPATLEALRGFYGPAEFRYADFCRDVAEAEAEPGAAPRPAALDAALRRLKAFLVDGMFRPLELFHAVDPAGAGHCRRERVQGCLNMSRGRFTDDEVDAILGAFPVDGYPERFAYRDLCRALDAIPMDQAAATPVVDPLFTQKRLDLAENALHAIREKLNLKRMSPWVFFAGLRDRISERDFRDRLWKMGIDLRNEEVEVIAERFAGRDGIAWKPFCTAVEQRVFF